MLGRGWKKLETYEVPVEISGKVYNMYVTTTSPEAAERAAKAYIIEMEGKDMSGLEALLELKIAEIEACRKRIIELQEENARLIQQNARLAEQLGVRCGE